MKLSESNLSDMDTDLLFDSLPVGPIGKHAELVMRKHFVLDFLKRGFSDDTWLQLLAKYPNIDSGLFRDAILEIYS